MFLLEQQNIAFEDFRQALSDVFEYWLPKSNSDFFKCIVEWIYRLAIRRYPEKSEVMEQMLEKASREPPGKDPPAMLELTLQRMFDELQDKGKKEGKKDFLMRALKTRFKKVPSSIAERIAQIHDQKVLETLFDKAMTVRGLLNSRNTCLSKLIFIFCA